MARKVLKEVMFEEEDLVEEVEPEPQILKEDKPEEKEVLKEGNYVTIGWYVIQRGRWTRS